MRRCSRGGHPGPTVPRSGGLHPSVGCPGRRSRPRYSVRIRGFPSILHARARRRTRAFHVIVDLPRRRRPRYHRPVESCTRRAPRVRAPATRSGAVLVGPGCGLRHQAQSMLAARRLTVGEAPRRPTRCIGGDLTDGTSDSVASAMSGMGIARRHHVPAEHRQSGGSADGKAVIDRWVRAGEHVLRSPCHAMPCHAMPCAATIPRRHRGSAIRGAERIVRCWTCPPGIDPPRRRSGDRRWRSATRVEPVIGHRGAAPVRCPE